MKEKRVDNQRVSGFRGKLLSAIALFACVVTAIALVVLLSFILLSEQQTPLDLAVISLLLICQLLLAVQSLGYFINVFTTYHHTEIPAALKLKFGSPDQSPSVAVVVCSYKEPLAVLENTLICFYNITYPGKRLYFLDDTRYELNNWTIEEKELYREQINQLCAKYDVNLFRRRWRGAKAGIINDFLKYLRNEPDPGFEMIPAVNESTNKPPEYLVVFDADQNPLPNFIDDLVTELAANPKLAFIQTPQYYSNFENNLVARLSGLQQVVFYEYICEGKGHNNSMFCCGTNVMFRVQALQEVHGFDEDSVTEDFATSIKLHIKGWHSRYAHKIMAFGEGPRDLSAYFSQQNRWALGCSGLIAKILGLLMRTPGSLRPLVWWEYLISSTHYFCGWIHMINCLQVIVYLFFGIPRVAGLPAFVFLITVPYLIITLGIFLWSLNQRGYRVFDCWLATLLTFVSFPVYMKATLFGFLGKKSKFVVTPKEGQLILPLSAFWPQLLMGSACFAAAVWGLHRAYFDELSRWGLVLSSFWGFYFALLSFAVIFINIGFEDSSVKAK